ncbi:hypothetical protein A2645_00120 [Candidatus Nomurabacteria bacterium RIFCSPHIGHO2_01_FULL_39_9]|uniref:Uncharacterized protein n=1 Tax=Candidatus Nomurabacteria bacterium RIFCSPHIGHO2_01_FULL_39_9 TaxID=1801735 RepID=A0A1F6UVF8_9BACT|nr:MAG: hypothetical protein A2645_00120 [Candidatus Nomurabacteria bacterium RIFCSPHIGHO2_01_FULL_39_9]
MKYEGKISRKKKEVKLTYWSYDNNPDNIKLPMAYMGGSLSEYWTNLIVSKEVPENELEFETNYWLKRITRDTNEKLFVCFPKNLYEKVVQELEKNKENFNINLNKVRDKRLCKSVAYHDNFAVVLSGNVSYTIEEKDLIKDKISGINLCRYDWRYRSFIKNLFFAPVAKTGGVDGRPKENHFWSRIRAYVKGLFFPLKHELNLHKMEQFAN